MIDRRAWNAYVRDSRDAPWRWLASGATFGEANGAAAVLAPGLERTVLFGKQLPGRDGEPLPVRRRRCY